jgi:hypothetical protein
MGCFFIYPLPLAIPTRQPLILHFFMADEVAGNIFERFYRVEGKDEKTFPDFALVFLSSGRSSNSIAEGLGDQRTTQGLSFLRFAALISKVRDGRIFSGK